MASMNSFQIFERNPFLSFSVPLLNSLETDLRRTSEIYDCFQWTIFGQLGTQTVVDLKLCGLEIAELIHYLSKDMAISKWRALRKMKLFGLLRNGLVPEEGAGVHCIQLEGEGPSLGILVVVFDDVTTCESLPVIDRLLDDRKVEKGKESTFASSKVPFNRNHS